MALSRRDRRLFAELAEQLAREDAALAELLSSPAEHARGPGCRRAALVVGRVLFVVGWVLVAWGAVTSTSISVGVILLLVCWVPWQYGSEGTR